jgi:hypothetical protein
MAHADRLVSGLGINWDTLSQVQTSLLDIPVGATELRFDGAVRLIGEFLDSRSCGALWFNL